MAEYGTTNTLTQPTTAKASRINSDVERVQTMAGRVGMARDRVTRQTAALGYFSDAPENSASDGKIMPISNNLQTALNELERAIERLHGELNLFD